MCDACAATHARQAADKRAARKRRRECHVCGAAAVVINGVALTTCPAHRDYYAERARAS